jgi:hypothetical protein
VSSTEKVFGVIKSVMLMHERFDGLDERIKRLDGDLSDLARSHATLAQRVAEMEGYLRAATGTPFGGRPRIERK